MDRVVCKNIPRCINAGRGEPYLSAVQSKRRTIAMGFPSPASDYVETRISLDQQLISQSAATYFMRASRSHFREGIIQGRYLLWMRRFQPVMVRCWYVQEIPNSPSAPPDKSGERERCQKMVMATIPHTQYLELSRTSLMMPGTRSLMTARLCR